MAQQPSTTAPDRLLPGTLANQMMLNLLSYQTDFWQRSVLHLDALRQRAENMIEHERAGTPPLLAFDYETVLDVRRLERPANLHGQLDAYPQSPFGRCEKCHLAAIVRDDLLQNRQPEAMSRRTLIQAPATFAELRQGGGWHSRSIVLDLEHQGLFRTQAQATGHLFTRPLAGVIEHNAQHLVQVLALYRNAVLRR